MPIRVLIFDQHEIIRAGIKLACSHRDDLEVVGESNNLEGAVDLAQQTQADVAIVDPTTTDAGGLALVGKLHEALTQLRILVFTTDDGPEFAQAIMASGAAGYLTKEAGIDEIAVAIRCVHLGRIFISHSHSTVKLPAATSLATDLGSADDPNMDPAGPPQLSGREAEVLSLLGDGLTNKQAAEKLFLSVKTVETYRARIMKKHNLKDRAQLVQFARKAAAANEGIVRK